MTQIKILRNKKLKKKKWKESKDEILEIMKGKKKEIIVAWCLSLTKFNKIMKILSFKEKLGQKK